MAGHLPDTCFKMFQRLGSAVQGRTLWRRTPQLQKPMANRGHRQNLNSRNCQAQTFLYRWGALPAGTPAPMPMPPQSLQPTREPLRPGEVDPRMLPGENGRPSPFMERPKMPSMNQPPSSKPDGARNPLSRAFPAAWSPIEVAGWRNLKPVDSFASKKID